MIPSADSHFLELCRRLMQQPAIAYHEENIIQEVEQICREAGLDFVVDAYGNRIVTLATAPERAPIALVAHMDHPGFEVIHKRSDTVLEARFLGGVGPSYFKPGVPLRVYPGGLAATLGGKLPGEEHFEIVLNTALSAVTPEFAVWDLVPHEVTADQIRGRACDDLIGVATILETLCRLKESGAAVHVKGLITRAEEVGFHGSLLLAESGMISKESWVISLETSRELPPVLMGRGAILRVGDRA